MRPILDGEMLAAYENLIYLPMVLTIFRKDREQMDTVGFKFKRPYQALIDLAIRYAENDLRDSRIYLKKNDYKLYKAEQNAEFTEYVFLYQGHEDHRKYLNLRLRNRTEELMTHYLDKGLRSGELIK